MRTFNHDRAPVPTVATLDPNAKEVLSVWMSRNDKVYMAFPAEVMPMGQWSNALAAVATNLAKDFAEGCDCDPIEAIIAMRMLFLQGIDRYISAE